MSATSSAKESSDLMIALESLIAPISRLESTIQVLEDKSRPLLAGRTGRAGVDTPEADSDSPPLAYRRIEEIKARLSALSEYTNDLVNDIRI